MPKQGAGKSTPIRCRWGGSFFDVRVPDKLPNTLRRVVAGFLALHPSWLDVRWDDGDLLLSWSDEAPLLTRAVRDRLSDIAAEFPLYRKRGLEGQQITVASLGVRATRKAGISVATTKHSEVVGRLNRVVWELLGGAVAYHAIAIVRHGDVACHHDHMNDPDSLMCLIPLADGEIWIEDAMAGTAVEQDELGHDRQGTWHAYSRGLSQRTQDGFRSPEGCSDR
eukprot:1019395-Amphidinium_carterae.2